MNINEARAMLPAFAEAEVPRRNLFREVKRFDMNRFIRNHMVTVILLAAMLLEGVIIGAGTAARVRKETEARCAAEYAAALEQYKADQAREVQASYFLSGEASREAAINQEVDAVAAVISKLSTDAQKGTEACCMLARVMSPFYPNSFEEVALQPSQWMFFDGTDKTFSVHDREIADKIVRPYMESGIVPNGLTADMVYGAWSTNDFVLRDSYQNSATMHTFRWNG